MTADIDKLLLEGLCVLHAVAWEGKDHPICMEINLGALGQQVGTLTSASRHALTPSVPLSSAC